MAPRDRRALWPRPRSRAHVPFAHLFLRPPRHAAAAAISSFPPPGCLARRAERRAIGRLMSEIDLGNGTLAWPALIRHPRKKKR